MFAQNNRLTKSSDIQRIISTGKRHTTPHLRLYWLANSVARPRLTVVVSKKTAKFAVTRNRIKRRVRAALKGLTGLPSIDVIVFPKQEAATLPFTVLEDQLKKWQDKL